MLAVHATDLSLIVGISIYTAIYAHIVSMHIEVYASAQLELSRDKS